MIRNPRALPLLVVIAVLAGCAGKNPRDPVTLTMSNKVSGSLDILLVPQFDMPDSPAAENVRSLELASGQTQVIELPRGQWSVTSKPKDLLESEGRHATDHKFHADGEVIFDDKLIRYHKTGPERAPEMPAERKKDPTDRNAAR